MTNKMEKPKISPEEYKRVIQGLDLKNISMQDSKASLNTEIKVPTELNISIKDEAEFKVRNDGEVLIFHNYVVDARKPESKSKFIKLETTFLVKMTSKESFTQDFFDIYKNVSLHLNTWPYFREFVNQMTARMNVSPLTLPLFKTP
jgi:hypothetical protein